MILKTMAMVIDPLPSSNVNIEKYLSRHKINILEDIYNSSKVSKACSKTQCCALGELVMLKEFSRDEDLFFKNQLDEEHAKNYIVNNGHIYNMLHAKTLDDKLYKSYMREFKKRRHKWQYKAIVVRNSKQLVTAQEKQTMQELSSILKQSQIDFHIINNVRTVTLLRKEIYKNLLPYL